MADLRDEVPEINPDRDALIDYGLSFVDAVVPVFGTAAADLVRGTMARRDQERQHDFNVRVAVEVTGLAERVQGLTPETIFHSDEFMAAYSKASRFASESASTSKRARLARAITRSGPWSDLTKEKGEYFLDVAGRYSDLHVFLLVFAQSPSLWLDKHAPHWRAEEESKLSLTPYKTSVHPQGGTIHWFEVDGRQFTILGNDYPYADDFEIQERTGAAVTVGDEYAVVPGTEKRAATWGEGVALIAAHVTFGIDELLDKYVFPGSDDWREVVGPALGDISTDGFGQIGIAQRTPLSQAVAKHTYPFGDEFLAFLGEGDVDSLA